MLETDYLYRYINHNHTIIIGHVPCDIEPINKCLCPFMQFVPSTVWMRWILSQNQLWYANWKHFKIRISTSQLMKLKPQLDNPAPLPPQHFYDRLISFTLRWRGSTPQWTLLSWISLKSQISSLIFFFFQETGNRAEHVVKIKLDSLVILQKNSYDEAPVYGKHPANKFCF